MPKILSIISDTIKNIRIAQNKSGYSRSEAKQFLISTTINTFIILVFWYPFAVMASAFLMISQSHLPPVLTEIAYYCALILPVLLLVMPLIISYIFMQRNHYVHAITALKINWHTLRIAIWCIIIFVCGFIITGIIRAILST